MDWEAFWRGAENFLVTAAIIVFLFGSCVGWWP